MVFKHQIFFFLFYFAISNIVEDVDTACIELDDTATVEIKHGRLRGKIEQTILINKTFYAFRGIPYAAAPIGEFRFKAPQPLKKWAKTLDATKYGQICTQISSSNPNTVVGGEDCLFINVFTPELPKRKISPNLKPVLFFIHGGAFRTGSGYDSRFGPDFFIEEDVVLVTVNSRLGVFGFLSLENVEIPGNFGLKDLVQGLRWVKCNIASFGGDPNSITMFGQSTGAASAHFLMISPLARGLFHRVALQSGNVVTPRSLSSHSMKERAFKLGSILGFNTTDSKELAQFLQTASASDLTLAVSQVLTPSTEFSEAPELPFPPTVEPKQVGYEAIITSDPVELLKTGQFARVPTIIGHNNAEYIYFLDNAAKPENLKLIIENLIVGMPLRNITVPYNSDLYKNIVELIRDEYSLRTFTNESLSNYNELQSDIWYNVGTELAARIHSEVSSEPLYFYRFSYDGAFNYGKQLKNITIPGASHADELCYQFACDRYKEQYKVLKPDAIDYKMIKVWSKLYSNFARTGNPTPEKLDILDNIIWLPRTEDDPNVLEITENLRLSKTPTTTQVDKWFSIIKYIKQHVDST